MSVRFGSEISKYGAEVPLDAHHRGYGSRSHESHQSKRGGAPRFQTSARGTLVEGTGGLGFSMGGDAAYRLRSFLLIGGYVERTKMCCGTDLQLVAFGPRIELQPFPEATVEPWIGVSLGAAIVSGPMTNPAALETAFDCGIQAHVTRTLLIGGHVGLALFPGNLYRIPADLAGFQTLGIRVGLRL